MTDAELAVMKYGRKSGARPRWRDLVCTLITYCALFLIALLAIPACAAVGLIGAVWWLADKAIRAIE